MKMEKILSCCAMLFLMLKGIAQDVYPSSWWIGMKHNQVQLLIRGKNLDTSLFEIHHAGVSIKQKHAFINKNYIAIDVEIAPIIK